MKIRELLENIGYDDFDDEVDHVEDPEKDKTPHLVMQLRKAQDVDGNYDVRFKDGSKHKLAPEAIDMFLSKYDTLMPDAKEKMQEIGSENKQSFEKIVQFFQGRQAPKSIYREGEKHGNSKVYDKCWTGYKKVPGKKRGEKGSCEKA